MIFVITAKSEAGNDTKTCTDVKPTYEVCFNLAHCRTEFLSKS